MLHAASILCIKDQRANPWDGTALSTQHLFIDDHSKLCYRGIYTLI